MMLSNQEQLMRLFACLGFGVWLSVWQDVFRLWRAWHKPSRWGLFFQDILFAVSGVLMLFLFALGISGGILNVQMLAATGVGFFICRQTFGRLVTAGIRGFRKIAPPLSRLCRHITDFLVENLRNSGKKVAFFSKKGLHRATGLLYNKNRK